MDKLFLRSILLSLKLQRQVSAHISIEARRVLSSTMRAPETAAQIETHAKKVENLKKLSDAAFPLRPDAVVAAAIGTLVVVSILVLSQLPVGTARITASVESDQAQLLFEDLQSPLEVDAPAVRIFKLGMTLQDPGLTADASTGPWAIDGEAKLSSLKVYGRQSEFQFSGTEGDRAELRVLSDETRVVLDAQAGAKLSGSKSRLVKGKSDFINLSSSKMATLNFGPELRFPSARKMRLRFSIPQVAGNELKSPISAIYAGYVVLHDVGGQRIDLSPRQQLGLDGFSGTIQVMASGGRVRVELEGDVQRLDAGPKGYERSLKPSLLQCWSKKSELTFLLALVGSLWTIAWTVRKTIFSGAGA